MPGVIGYALTIEDQALLQYNNRLQPVMLKGVDGNYKNINGVSQNIFKGAYDLGSSDHPSAVLGSGVENSLELEADRSLVPMTVYLFRTGSINPADPESAVRSESLLSSGTFRIQEDFDEKYVITNLEFMQRMMALDSNQYGAVEIAVRRGFCECKIKIILTKRFWFRISCTNQGRAEPDFFWGNENGKMGNIYRAHHYSRRGCL